MSLKPEEWLYGIEFLTEVGKACTPFRQEFILLSDTLGVSCMVSILDVSPEPGPPGCPVPELRSIHYDFTLTDAAEGEVTSRVGADPSSLVAAQ